MVHWGLRRKQLCDPNLCPDAPEGGRCDKCPLVRLEECESSELGQLMRRALDLRAILEIGVPLTLDDIAADELYAMLVIEEERNRYDEERSKGDS